MPSRDPQHTPSPPPDVLDRLPVRTPADLAGTIGALAEALGRATMAGNTLPELVAQAERQFAKAVEQAHAAPIDKTMLLIHLVAARAFLNEGQAPPALVQPLDRVIAQVHALVDASPAAFCYSVSDKESESAGSIDAHRVGRLSETLSESL